jgi:hypothetical protein
MNYDHNHAKDHVAKLKGMVWDEAFAEQADEVLHKYGVPQRGWDVIIPMYANRIHQMFTPTNFSYWQRTKIACHFLNPFARK